VVVLLVVDVFITEGHKKFAKNFVKKIYLLAKKFTKKFHY